ncbi:MAG: polysaccharide lyase [Terriglobia bacterium]
MKFISVGLFLAVGCATLPSWGQKATKSFYDGFEAQQINGWRVSINAIYDPAKVEMLTQVEQKKDGAINQSSEHVRAGKFALKMTVPHQFGNFRSEIARLTPIPMGSEYWYGFSIYLPSDWQVDSQGNILAQWHSILPRTHREGDGSGKPPVAITVIGNHWFIRLNWNSSGSGSTGKGARAASFDLGKIRPGAWVDYVLDARWSAGDGGMLRLWKDGKMVLNHNGPNEYSTNKVGPYFKIGIYHPRWKTIYKDGLSGDKAVTRAIVVYDDEVRITPAPASYEDVRPRGDKAF